MLRTWSLSQMRPAWTHQYATITLDISIYINDIIPEKEMWWIETWVECGGKILSLAKTDIFWWSFFLLCNLEWLRFFLNKHRSSSSMSRYSDIRHVVKIFFKSTSLYYFPFDSYYFIIFHTSALYVFCMHCKTEIHWLVFTIHPALPAHFGLSVNGWRVTHSGGVCCT